MSDRLLQLQHPDLAKLILRLTVGGLMLFHGIHKIFSGVGFIAGKFEAIGLPAALAYLVFLGEIVAPVLLIIGYKTRIGAALIIATMIIAIFLAFPGQWFALSKAGALAMENQYLFIFSSLAILLLGAGKYSIEKK
jgi:putative oxidoreductase